MWAMPNILLFSQNVPAEAVSMSGVREKLRGKSLIKERLKLQRLIKARFQICEIFISICENWMSNVVWMGKKSCEIEKLFIFHQ